MHSYVYLNFSIKETQCDFYPLHKQSNPSFISHPHSQIPLISLLNNPSPYYSSYPLLNIQYNYYLFIILNNKLLPTYVIPILNHPIQNQNLCNSSPPYIP